jgi:hypothetical protein
LLAALAALTASGCGDTPPSLTQLQNQASRVCVVAARQMDLIPSPAVPIGGEAFLTRGVAVLAPELAQLRSLTAPREAADVYSTAMRALSQKVSAVRSTVRSLDQGADPVVSVRTLQQRLTPLESQEDGAWQALEIPACLNR